MSAPGGTDISTTWTFSPAFSSQCFMAFGMKIGSDIYDSNWFGYPLARPTRTSAKIGWWGSYAGLFLAFGK